MVGLSKETAHQLGTPISSLIAWVEYLRTKDIDPSLLTEMDKDVKRLQTIAERFSKIGSDPDPVPTNIVESIRAALGVYGDPYFLEGEINTYLPERPILVLMNDSLFAWVIENLTKNAVDAMEGQGEISLKVEEREKVVLIDLADTGKGIPKSKFKTVFQSGVYDQETWLGTRLVLGKAYYRVLPRRKDFREEFGAGERTTFRIKLKKYKG